ncbi:RusA family crossover junction endodeoxyribonuclease [bacterium]|nr:RusA family crossover junction endodeoxyribonuclease [bacterium]
MVAPTKGRNGFYSKHSVAKKQIAWQLQPYFNHEQFKGAIWADITFYRPIPKGTSSIRKQQMLNGLIWPIGKPDRTNLLKFIEDCLEEAGIVSNDSIIVDGPVRKLYGLHPKTIIKLESMDKLYTRESYEARFRKD